MADLPDVPSLLASAVQALGGVERANQLTMASAVAESISAERHLAVQAGTGTGKSLAYLVPSIRHALETAQTVVVSTATIALQNQLVDRDLPRLAKALEGPLGRTPKFAILKGRNNYVCRNKTEGTVPEDPAEELFDAFAISRLGREVQKLHAWAAETETGDRDEVKPGVSDRAWRQVSVNSRECLGRTRCPFGEECFAELARAKASKADVVVTNHALLAIDAISGIPVLPEHDVVVIDEAHELVDRVTSAATAELSPGMVTMAARRCTKLVEDGDVDRLEAAAEAWDQLLGELAPGRWDEMPDGAAAVLALIRDSAWNVRTALAPPGQSDKGDPDTAAARGVAVAAIDDVHDAAVRALTAFDADPAARRDVVWLAFDDMRSGAQRRVVRVAPLAVGGLLRTRLFEPSTVVLTSATLQVGGSFDGLAINWGLPPQSAEEIPPGMAWSALDVGSPFDHRKAGILYLAKHLPQPGRDGLQPAYLDEIEELITAAGGRTLALFSSMRAARAAAEAMTERLSTPVLCQGDDSMPALVTRFAEDESASLFGTLTLWQGVDVPGRSLSLVIMDRIPFPRPDDPLLVARQRAVESRGGNGFMTVAVTHAALLLAQGTGRLLRSVDDRGVIAVLDPRLATARYGGFLRASLPPYWTTTDPQLVRKALRRLVGD
ncbi:ATP-dependent DNA helicase [Smaragdicoccus niigatensis]|uniref:ATP-dependent DNA helicase n=1 Tax=Smaragdicoccus niigatensis TaxID=359359 RepID=UPI000371FD7E|nr:ATP-dependent DNA helicase [Smaragdicoccus niigatensis]